jgi:hypothetical protein
LDGDWEFELKPTMDNRWGDFRLPIEDALMIGAEARIFKYAEEPVAQPAWESTDLDDSKWARAAVGFGRKFWLLGPLPASIAPEQLDTTLAGLTTVNPAIPVNCAGTNFYWRPYDFSWRWGREGDPGHQGWHGLKENVTDQFICLGKPQAGHNETTYGPEPGGTRYYLWTTAQVPTDTRVSVSVGGLTPAAVYVGGKLVRTNEWIGGHSGSTIVLARYEQHGRGHLVVRAPRDEKRERTPLAMRWHDDPGVLPLETRPATNGFAGWYRFTAPPGLQSMRVAAYGSVQAWVDGDKCDVSKGGALESHPGASFYTVDVSQQCPRSSRVALRISQARGYQGGAALPEPVALKCGVGLAQAGDWSQGTALGNYSGSAWYRRDIMVEPSQLKGRLLLDLGEVVATAEVRVNGQPAGIRVAPPWVFDITPLAREGKNRLEILICNTLANHYSTVPSKYQGSLRSGLIGPVSLVPQPLTILRERD